MARCAATPAVMCALLVMSSAALPSQDPAPALDECAERGAAWLADRIASLDDPRALALAIAALAQRGDPMHAATVAAGRARLCATQTDDGKLGGADAPETATWLGVAALAGSSEEKDRAAAERARRFLARAPAADTAPHAADPAMERALRFLHRGADAASAPMDEATWRICAAAGGAFDVRAAYRELQRSGDATGSALGTATGLPDLGALHACHVAALVLAHYRSARLAPNAGASLPWGEAIADFVRARFEPETQHWRDATHGDEVATASALLALDAVRPWLGIGAAGDAAQYATKQPAELDASCADCHARLEPGLHRQWESSAHAQRGVSCADCHGKNHSLVFREQGRVSPLVCGGCHAQQAEEFRGSRHAHAGETLRASALFAATPPAMQSACFGCHDIGRAHADGSTGSCNACHAGHAFRAADAREPEACTTCHTGNDYPQERAYALSKHGALHATTHDERIAPTCATCHQPGGTHDDRYGIALGGSGVGAVREGHTAPIPMPAIGDEAFAEQRAAMVRVCADCHSSRFAEDSLAAADRIKSEGDRALGEAVAILDELRAHGLLGPNGDRSWGSQVRADPGQPGSELLHRFYEMWRFHYTAAWKGAYHQSPSIANRESSPGLAEDLAALRAAAEHSRSRKGNDR